MRNLSQSVWQGGGALEKASLDDLKKEGVN
jgi:hypothetical protein